MNTYTTISDFENMYLHPHKRPCYLRGAMGWSWANRRHS